MIRKKVGRRRTWITPKAKNYAINYDRKRILKEVFVIPSFNTGKDYPMLWIRMHIIPDVEKRVLNGSVRKAYGDWWEEVAKKGWGNRLAHDAHIKEDSETSVSEKGWNWLDPIHISTLAYPDAIIRSGPRSGSSASPICLNYLTDPIGSAVPLASLWFSSSIVYASRMTQFS